VYTIAVNEFHQFLRKEAAEHRRRKILEQKGVVSLTEGGMRLMEIREALLHAVDELSPQRQKVYWLSREEQLTIPEIADKLRLSSSTVKHTLMAALNGIREYLEKAGFTPFF
jgi:RNA polymerase sigma-70 factor (ECF subfamily)